MKRRKFTALILTLSLTAAGLVRAQAPASGRAGEAANDLDTLNDKTLMAELASRGLSDLLSRAFEVNKVPQQERDSMSTLMALRELSDPAKSMSASRRQALIASVVNGISAALPTISDARTLMAQAAVLIQNAIEPDVTTIEYWGENAATQRRLKPIVETVDKMLARAAELADKGRAEAERKLGANRNDDRLVKDWTDWDNLFTSANFTRQMAQYDAVLALDRKNEQRAKIADAAITYLKDFDNAGSGVQVVVRNRMAKLNMAKFDYPAAKELFNLVITGKDIAPPPTPFQQYEARYFSVVCDVESKSLDAAAKGFAELQEWQTKNLPQDKDVQAWLSAIVPMMKYRIHMAEKAAAKPDSEEAKKAEDAAVATLTKLSEERPDLRSIISEQLVQRLASTADIKTLNPLMLTALLQKGIQETSRPAKEQASEEDLNHAIAAAQELMSRKADPQITPQMVDNAAIYVPAFQERLGKKVEAASAFLDYVEKIHTTPQNTELAFNRAANLILELQKSAGTTQPAELTTQASSDTQPADPGAVMALYERLLPIAINQFGHKELALDYGNRLRKNEKFPEAIKYYRMVPKEDRTYLPARYYEMIAMTMLLDQKGPDKKPLLQGPAREALVGNVLKTSDEVRILAAAAMKSGTANEQTRQKMRLAGVMLTSAQIAATEQKDPKKVIESLADFDATAASLPNEDVLLTEALKLRVRAFMDSQQYNQASDALVKLIEKSGGQKGSDIVLTLLQKLNQDFDKAQAAGDQAQMKSLINDRAKLSGFLVKWASENPSADVKKYTYRYMVYDAETKRLAGMFETEPAQREKELRAAMEAFENLLSPQNAALYRQTLDDTRKADGFPDPLVVLGIGLTQFELKSYSAARDSLGRLLTNRKLGTAHRHLIDPKTGEARDEDNEPYWEASYKYLKARAEVAKAKPDDANARKDLEAAQTELKREYVREGARGVGGDKWHAAFEELRKEITPDFDPTKLATGATQPVAQSP